MKNVVAELPKNGRPEALVSDVRVTPRVLQSLSNWVREHPTSNSEMAGLLFGTVTGGVVSVEALTRVSLPKPVDNGPGIGERLEKAFDESMSDSKLPRELASLGLIGWWCVRPVQKIRQLRKELEFHNQRFRRSTDVFAVVTVREARAVSARLFARSRHLPISVKHHRSTWLDLPSQILPSSRLLMIPAGAPNPDLCLVTYRSPKDLPRASHFRRQSAGSFLPAFLKRFPNRPALQNPAASNAKKIPFLVPAAFLLIAFAILAALMFVSNGSLKPAERRSTPPSPSNAGFRMQVESQKGGILIAWNDKFPAVRSATRAVLQIEDGSQSHTTELGSGDLAKGSIFYKPSASDVNLRLTMYDRDGSTLTDRVQFVDRSKQVAIADAAASSHAKSPTSAETQEPNPLPSNFANSISLPATPHQSVQMPLEAPVVAPSVSPQVNGLPTDLGTPPPAAFQPKPPPAEPAPSTAAPTASTSAPATASRPVPPERYVPPRPLKTVAPDLSTFAGSQLAGINEIEIEVDVNTSGHVTGARAVNKGQHVSWLVTAAVIEAAKKWTFQPATIGGRSVPAKHTIVFHVAGSSVTTGSPRSPES